MKRIFKKIAGVFLIVLPLIVAIIYGTFKYDNLWYITAITFLGCFAGIILLMIISGYGWKLIEK